MSHKENKYDVLIAKFLAGEISPAEKSELMAWTEASGANRAYFDEMVTLWSSAETPDEMFFDSDLENSWSAIEQALEPPTAKIRPLRGRRFLLRIAAVLLIGLSLSIWYLSRPDGVAELQIVHTGPNEKQEILLPDSSRVWLNGESRLAYSPDFTERKVELSGEAFFEVTKRNGATFSIYSGDAVTTVLGTTFNVRAYPDEDRVAVQVVTGKVKLARAEAEEEAILLEAGEAAVLKAASSVPVPDPEATVNDLAWQSGVLEFRDETLAVLLPKLEQYYGVSIRVSDPALLACHFSATFYKKSIAEVLEVISYALRLDVSEEDGTYLLSGEGCN